jgi:hypothetical protein
MLAYLRSTLGPGKAKYRVEDQRLLLLSVASDERRAQRRPTSDEPKTDGALKPRAGANRGLYVSSGLPAKGQLSLLGRASSNHAPWSLIDETSEFSLVQPTRHIPRRGLLRRQFSAGGRAQRAWSPSGSQSRPIQMDQ